MAVQPAHRPPHPLRRRRHPTASPRTISTPTTQSPPPACCAAPLRSAAATCAISSAPSTPSSTLTSAPSTTTSTPPLRHDAPDLPSRHKLTVCLSPPTSAATLRLLLRAAVQFSYLTPPPPPPPLSTAPRPAPAPTASALAILGANLFCLSAHLLLAPPPSAGDATRGYRHGGVIVDFVGQRPGSAARLALLDLVVAALQIAALSVLAALQAEEAGAPAVRDAEAQPQQPPRPRQDLDAEERGVRRRDTLGDDAIEMQALTPRRGRADSGGGGGGGDARGETASLLAAPPPSPLAPHPLDALHAGQLALTTLRPLATLRAQLRAYRAAVLERRTGGGGGGGGTAAG